MIKIAFIGAGSVVFTRELLTDICSMPALSGCHIALHDIDADRLATADAVAHWTAGALNAAPTITSHLDRRAAVDGAQYVINMVQVGMHDATLVDFAIPKRYGLQQTIADSYGIGGIFRALRTFGPLEELANDMATAGADGAWLLNYTNPMAMNCWFTYASTPVRNVVGLCHSVQHTTRHLADLAGVPFAEIDFVGAGINHQAWILRLTHDGRDLYPAVDDALARDPESARRVRVELYRRFGYFPTESSEHAAEYVPWFLGHDDEIDRFRIPIDEYVHRSEANLRYYERTKAKLAAGEGFSLDRSVEYAVEIIHAMETGEARVVYGNVANVELISNLPRGACVEVPCVVDGDGLRPQKVGDLPAQCAALNRVTLNVAELVVRAALDNDPTQIRRAAMLDPNVSSKLTIDAIWSMCDDLVEAHRDRLPEPLRVTLTR
jgi:alpha-galactosidase